MAHRAGDAAARWSLNEALELARDFSGDAAVRFVNGVLDAAFRQLAPTAVSSNRPADRMSNEAEQSAQRRANLDALAALGVDVLPAPVRRDRTP